MIDRELMQQALDALATYDGTNGESKRKRVLAALRERLAQPEQKPFCYHDGRNIVGKEYADHSDVFPLYTAPPKREWIWLTDEEILVCGGMDGADNWAFEFANAIQIKLRKKNT